MAESYSVKAILSVDDKGFAKSMSDAANSMNGLESTATKSSNSIVSMGAAFAVAEKAVSAVATAIGSSLADAVSRVDTLNQFPKIMEQMGFSSDEAETSIEKLSEGIVGLPTSLDTIVDSAQNIALITGNLDEATDVALALNNALIASGASTDEAARATEAYDKMLSTGKVTSQQWTTLEQDMKYALVEVAKELGITSGNTQELYAALQDGSITFDEFNDALVTCSEAQGGFAEMAQTASAGIATSWENVQTAVVRGVANVIQAYNEAATDNSLPTIQEALDSLRGVADVAFNTVASAVTGLVNNFNVLLAVVTPVVAGMAALKVADTVSKSFKKLQSAGKDAAQSLKDVADNTKTAQQAQEKQKAATEQLEAAQKKAAAAQDKMVQADQKLAEAAKKSEEAIKKKNEAAQLEEQYGEGATQAVTAHKEAEELAAEAEQLSAEARSMNAEATSELSSAEQESATATQAYTDAATEETSAQEASTTAAIAKNAILSVLTGQMSLAEAAQTAWNAAMAANPIGTVVTAATALVGVLGGVVSALDNMGAFEKTAWKQTKKLKEATKDLCDSVDDSVDSYNDNVKAVKESNTAIKEQVKQVTELANKQNKTADEMSTLESLVDALNDSVDGLNLAYDEQTDALNMTTAAVEALSDAYAAQQEYETAKEGYTQALQDQQEVTEQLTEATELYNNSLEELQTATAAGTDLGLGYSIMLAGQQSAVEDLSEAESECAEVISEAEQTMTDSRQAAADAAAIAAEEEKNAIVDSIDQQNLSLDQLSEKNQETVAQLQSTWQDYTDAATNMFDTLDTEVDTTVDDMIENMQKNQEIMAQWGDNTEALRDRFAALGLDPAILDQLVDLGPEGAGYIQELCDASDEKLAELSDVYSQGGEVAYQSMAQSMGEGAEEVIEQAKNLVTETESSFREQVEATDWTSLGTSMDEGVGEGITEGEAIPAEAATTMATDTREAAGAAAGEGSPAAEWIPLGESMVEGVAEGLNNSEMAAEAATAMAEGVREAAETAMGELDFTSVVAPAMESMASAVESGMSKVQDAVRSGISTTSSLLDSGFSTMASSATSGMSSIQSAVSSGMSSASISAQSGMSQIQSAFSTGLSQISQLTTSTMTSIKQTTSNSMTSAKTSITNSMKTAATNTKTSMTSLKTAVSTAMSSVKEKVSSTCTSIVSKFSALNGKLYKTGVSAMNGLTKGINSAGKSAISAAKSVANSVASAMSSALKVGSPSRVTREIGKWTGIGLANGLEATTGIVAYAANELAEVATPDIVTFASLAQPRSYSSESQLTANGLEAVDLLGVLIDIEKTLQSDDFMPDVYVQTELDIDGKEIAKTTAPYMQDEQDKLQARQSRRDKFAIG